jgi:hypothetical protein
VLVRRGYPSPKLLRSFGPPARGGLMRRKVSANGPSLAQQSRA